LNHHIDDERFAEVLSRLEYRAAHEILCVMPSAIGFTAFRDRRCQEARRPSSQRSGSGIAGAGRLQLRCTSLQGKMLPEGKRSSRALPRCHVRPSLCSMVRPTGTSWASNFRPAITWRVNLSHIWSMTGH